MPSGNAQFSDVASTEQEIAGVEAEIHRDPVALPDICAKRNSFLPVSRLPPETLAMIYVLGAREYHESDPDSCFKEIPAWVNVSYVCNYWRNIALNCPALWSYHFTISRRWTQELFLRSEGALLKVSSWYPSQLPWSHLLRGLLKRLERIQEFRLYGSGSLPFELFSCAPHLEKLEIEGDWNDIPGGPMDTGENKPTLRELKLVECSSIPWHSFRLTGLETLSLCYVHLPSSVNNMTKFLAILSGIQNLVILRLEHVLHNARSFLFSDGDTCPLIDLPRLALLAFMGSASTAVTLLSCINMPLKTQLNLEFLPEWGSPANKYAPVFSYLARRSSMMSEQPTLACPVFHSLTIIPWFFARWAFSSSEHDREPFTSMEKPGRIVPFKLVLGGNIEMELGGSVKDAILNDLHHVFPFANICNLCVTNPSWLSTAVWCELLGCLGGLRYLKLSNGPMPDLSLFSLKDSSGQVQGSAIGHAFVPALEALVLYRIVFDPDNSRMRPNRMSKKSLLDVLSTRKELRDQVSMIECRVRSDQGW